MMRILRSAILTVAILVGSSLSAQAATTISENLSGTISGASTTDTLGLFGPAGANLSGKPILIHYQYGKTTLMRAEPAERTRAQLIHPVAVRTRPELCSSPLP